MAAAEKQPRLHLLGIRHHGPGSARAVLRMLDEADPAAVLIEGPPDADEMIRYVASADMVPPVALLVHAEDDAANASFYPFAAFSPEWQAMRWALANNRPVRFIDLPMAHQLAERAPEKASAEAAATAIETKEAADEGDTSGSATQRAAEPEKTEPPQDNETAHRQAELIAIRRDPLSYLAAIAGYDDSEAWWNALIEQQSHGPEVFDAIGSAMTALRERLVGLGHAIETDKLREDRREAHMRLEIARTLGETEGAVAVVCGAWHVPALRARVPLKDDRALLKGQPKIKVKATWVPWTETRLAAKSGYGAGIAAPGWYAHLWTELDRTPAERPGDASPEVVATAFTSRWQARVADLLRKAGRPASTASVIEASRLAVTLASLRDLALPGLEEMREASLATLCEGETAPFRLIEERLVVGTGVGEIAEGVPQMPLAADLARQQRRLKMKPEALDSDLSLDLRSSAGLARSQLLHRLLLLKLPWGKPAGKGTSRGTFREIWRLRWDPEFSVRLAEALIYGTTIEIAAGNRAIAEARAAAGLDAVSDIVRGCLDAGLEAPASEAISILQARAAQSSDVANLAAAVPPLADVLRYGTAREIPLEPLRLLVTSLVEEVCAGLVYACRGVQAEAAEAMRSALAGLNVAISLIEEADLTAAWHYALKQVSHDASANTLLAGLAVRVLYDSGAAPPEEAATLFSRALSPSVPPGAAGAWIDGFLGTSGQILIHDQVLRDIIDRWLVSVGEEDFTNLLPVLRRGFSSFDRAERRRLLDEFAKVQATGTAPAAAPSMERDSTDASSDAPAFADALPLLMTILGVGPRSEAAT